MKKITIVFLSSMFLSSPLFARDYSSYCSEFTPDKSVVGSLMSASGVNFLARNIAEHEISKALKKETSSKFDVEIGSFWGTNILGGEFSSFSATCKNYSHDGLYMTDVKLSTICPYNKASYENNDVKFHYDTPLKYSAQITQENLDNMLAQSGYKRVIESVSATPLFKIISSNIEIKGNRLQFKYKISTLGLKSINLSYSAKLEVKDNKLVLSDIKLPSSKYLPFIKSLTNWKIDLNKNQKAHLSIENVKMQNSKIFLDGFVLIPKS